MDQPNSNLVTFNVTSSPGLPPRHDHHFRYLVSAVICFLFFVVGVSGNIAVIIIRPNWQRMSGLSQSLLLNLAISDLLCLLTLPIWIYAYFYGWTLGPVACKLLVCLVYCTFYSSALTAIGLSFQRYFMVVHQQSCQQVRKRLLLVLLWLVAFILSIPSLVVRDTETHQQLTRCLPQYSSDSQWVAVLSTETVFGLISFSLVVYFYIRLRRTVNQAAFFNNPQTTRLITRIILSLFVLWIPCITLNIAGVAGICLKNERLLKLFSSTRWLAEEVAFVNSCLNPLLYAFTSRKFCTACEKNEPLPLNQRFPQTQDSNIPTELY